MAWAQRLCLFVLLLSLVSESVCNDFYQCETTVKNWAAASAENGIKEEKLTLKDLLFFLHVPRTGGRTYFHCFLRKLYTNAHECPRSYDKLRFDPRKPNCRLMVTHDDYSLMSKLPMERTSVVTVLRNPIDRVFSTYEFSVEVAARFLVHPNLSSAIQMSGRVRTKSRGVSTLDIWPWKYLVPWMREDVFARRDIRRFVKSTRRKDIGNPYDMEDIVMPLQAFINDPVAHEIIHNGATFQVAGITNNSYLAQSHKVRDCVRMHPSLGQYVLEIAKNRLDHMLYVGLTEEHKESATMFANMVGAQILFQSETLRYQAEQEASNETEVSSTEDHKDDESSQEQHNSLAEGVPSPTDADNVLKDARRTLDAETTNQNMTVDTLMEGYGVCMSSLRKSQSTRRTVSLKRIAPANFSKEARLLVPERVLQEILSLNSLDVELYKHALDIFLQQKHLMQQNKKTMMHENGYSKTGTVQNGYNEQSSVSVLYRQEIQGQQINLDGFTPWKFYSLAVSALLFSLVVFVLTAKRRKSKVKV